MKSGDIYILEADHIKFIDHRRKLFFISHLLNVREQKYGHRMRCVGFELKIERIL